MPPRRRANCQICRERQSNYACSTCEVLYCSVACYKQHKTYSCSAPTSAVTSASDSSIEPIKKSRLGRTQDSSDKSGITGIIRSSAVSGRASNPVDESDVSASTAPVRDYASRVRQGEDLDVIAGTGNSSTEIDRTVEEEIDEGAATSQSQSQKRNQTDLETPHPLRKLSSLKWPYVPDTSSYPDPLTRDDPKPLTLAQYEAIARSPTIRRVFSTHTRLPSLLRTLDALRGAPRQTALENVLGVAPSQTSFSLSNLAPSSSSPSPSSSAYAYNNTRNEERKVGVNVDEEDMRALRELAEAVEAAVRSTANTSNGYGGYGVSPLGLDWEENMQTS